MKELIFEYGLFFAETITIVLAVGIIIVFIAAAIRRGRGLQPEHLEITYLNKKYDDMEWAFKRQMLTRKRLHKALKKDRRKKKKFRKKEGKAHGKRVFVIDFHGDIKASAVASLREEVTAILTTAVPGDEVLVRVENPGGMVHEHGLAASQLARIRQRNIPLTVSVDKIAASGGYLMACVANRILAAPFAIIGSIGVLAQLPNFHRLLEKHGIDFEQIKVGEFKRTLTLFGVNTDEDRAKLKEQLEETHKLFKDHVARYRPSVDIDKVATGEYWHAAQAMALHLIDDLQTSDDYLLAAKDTADLYRVEYVSKRRLGEKLLSTLQQGAQGLLLGRR